MELNEKKFVIGVFLDLRKAFDVVQHEILLNKLNKLGIANTVLKWFTSYLENRQQFVDIGGCHSSNRLIDISVLQGSILGPILFLCFDRLPSKHLRCVYFSGDILRPKTVQSSIDIMIL